MVLWLFVTVRGLMCLREGEGGVNVLHSGYRVCKWLYPSV